MKYTIIAVLLIFALVGLNSCEAASVELMETSSTTRVIEETRQNMDADHELWRKNKELFAKKIEDELADKGWSDFEVNTGSEARYIFWYHVVGCVDDKYDNPMTVSVSIVFSEDVPEGKLDYVTYTSESGRWYGCTEILPANDQRLYDYMHDLSLPQVQ